MARKNEMVADDFFSDYEGAGMENVSTDHLIIPRITILQKLSPQLSRLKI